MQKDHREPRLLAIDDSVLIHRLLKARLMHERIEIHSASSGQEGLAMARSLLPDVILLDLDMPDMDGFEVLAQLKADPPTRELPVIFLSSSAETTDKVKGLDMGAIDFIAKPFELAELKARVRAAIRLRLLIKMLAQRAQVDGLTGLWNRAYFDQRLAQEIASSLRHRQPLALILCDIDRFKTINDTFGHPFGDGVLEELARFMSDGRAGDVPCRYGGEEFGIIMPGTNADDAFVLADRLRRKIEEARWAGQPDLTVTASFGAADLARTPEATPVAMVHLADQALYAAKSAGRNRVEVAPGNSNVRMSA
jgi:diguanylate cyclase (GGDEF)-like protein